MSSFPNECNFDEITSFYSWVQLTRSNSEGITSAEKNFYKCQSNWTLLCALLPNWSPIKWKILHWLSQQVFNYMALVIHSIVHSIIFTANDILMFIFQFRPDAWEYSILGNKSLKVFFLALFQIWLVHCSWWIRLEFISAWIVEN